MKKILHKDNFGNKCREFSSHGTGKFSRRSFCKIGKNVIFEKSVKVFYPKNIEIGNNVYFGHNCYLKGYFKNKLIIGNNVWIGQEVFLHASGGIIIEDGVGIGPYAKILTSEHFIKDKNIPILYSDQEYAPVIIGYGVNIGIGSIILPGIKIGKHCIIGAGAVVTKNIPDYSIVAGIPARIIKIRK